MNRKHKGHLVVLTEVVTVALSLSTDHIVLSPSGSLPADAGMLSFITHDNVLPVNHFQRIVVPNQVRSLSQVGT